MRTLGLVAAVMMPGIFTSCDTWLDCSNSHTYPQRSASSSRSPLLCLALATGNRRWNLSTLSMAIVIVSDVP